MIDYYPTVRSSSPVQQIEQEQAEAIIQLQMATTLLDNVFVMGKHYEADSYDDDYFELGADELEAVADGEYTVLQLWRREGL